jgi:hypothetical protein
MGVNSPQLKQQQLVVVVLLPRMCLLRVRYPAVISVKVITSSTLA